jgi:hypothetical protein
MAEENSEDFGNSAVVGATNGARARRGVEDVHLLPGNNDQDTDSGRGRAEKNGHGPALFWSAPLSTQEELNWFVPPLPHHEDHHAQHEEMLQQFGGLMDKQPKRAWLLKWNYRTRAAATGAELQDVEREAQAQLARLREQSERDVQRLDNKIGFLRDSQQTLEGELIEAKKSFAECAARAGLNCTAEDPPEPARHTRQSWLRRAPEPEPDPDGELIGLTDIGPHRVEEALEDAKPTLQEMAGEYGVGPVGHKDFLSTLLSFFMQFLAPLVSGLMLALCLGTLVGILDIDTLQRADGAPKLALSAALGFVIVYLMGELYQSAVGSLARSLESREQQEDYHGVLIPRHRGNLGLAVALVAVALVLGCAEITAEGLGIRQLHEQQLSRQMRLSGAGGAGNPSGAPTSELPLIVFLVIGTLISGPYLAYKTARGWNEGEMHLREAWLTHRQRVWLEERRANPDVQQAFHRAYVVQHLESSLQKLHQQLIAAEKARDAALQVELHPTLQARRQAARGAAVGEAARLQQMLEDIVDTTEPPPQPITDRRGAGTALSARRR